jgi:hypothetical protein
MKIPNVTVKVEGLEPLVAALRAADERALPLLVCRFPHALSQSERAEVQEALNSVASRFLLIPHDASDIRIGAFCQTCKQETPLNLDDLRALKAAKGGAA